MRYEITCRCGKVLTGQATHDNYAVWCDCGLKHLARATGIEHTATTTKLSPRRAYVPRKKKESPRAGNVQLKKKIQDELAVSAIILIVLSSITVTLMAVSCTFDAVVLTVQNEEESTDPFMAYFNGKILIRLVWGIIMLVSNVVILIGAINLKFMKSLGLSKAAATMSLIPCIGPCFIIGIPFGLMALSILNRPEVSDAFEK